MANDFWLEDIPNYKELCYDKCPDDFNPDNIPEEYKFTIAKFDNTLYMMKDETQILVVMSAQIGLCRINKENACEWLTRLSLLQGLHGHFLQEIKHIGALYVAEELVKEISECPWLLPLKDYLTVDVREKLEELRGLVVDQPKKVALPRKLNPLNIIAHSGFRIDVKMKSFDEFCKEIREKSRELIEDNVEKMTEEQKKRNRNKKKRNNKKKR